MDFTALITAFGGGMLAAAIGGVPSFVFTGLTVIAAIMGGDYGAPAVGALSFGSIFGPHIAFGGAVAGAAYAKSKNLLDAGADIVTPLFKTGDAGVLLVGGVFGIIGFLIQHLVGPILGGLIGNTGWTDTVALTVLISAIIVRLVFTKSGITGKYTGSEPRQYFPSGKRLTFLIMVGIGVAVAFGGLAVTFGTLALDGSAEALMLFTNAGSLTFGIAAFSLAFLCMGLPLEGWHHVGLPAASTAVIVFASTQNGILAIVCAIVMGICTSVFGEFAALTFNSYADSHIDPPAVTICIFQFINFTLLAMAFAPTGIFA